jgi:hypothetical protein
MGGDRTSPRRRPWRSRDPNSKGLPGEERCRLQRVGEGEEEANFGAGGRSAPKQGGT